MADLVPADDIERIVGAKRKASAHVARAISSEQRVYILHSQACLDQRGHDGLLKCPFTLALDNGIALDDWTEDEALYVGIAGGRLTPIRGPRP